MSETREPYRVPDRTPASSEDATSQIPALDLLQQLGWTYLSPDEVNARRGGRRAEVLLKDVLRERLAAINRHEVRGREHAFTAGAIEDAIAALSNVMDDGLVRTNEKVWDLLRLGKSVPQTVDGDRRSPQLAYIDWKHPENNAYHVTEEFEVTASGSTETRRPDIVGFVNGIPFLVIECKPASLPGGKDPVETAISQHLRNQGASEIPQIFHHAQLLVALAVNQARYGVVGTPLRFWQRWREQELDESELERLLGARTAGEADLVRERLARYSVRGRKPANLDGYCALIREGRSATEQDRLLYALARPQRLLEITRSFNVFDGGERKVARYPQFFCVKRTLEHIRTPGPDGARPGGVVWHTQGSGKSLTMVMLAQAILETFRDRDPRILLVTDRVDLDDQIYGVFKGAGVDLAQAEDGAHLRELLADPRARVVTTLVHKFLRALKRGQTLADDPEVFVLVDESHRTHAGVLHAAMERALPRACYLGFTGTPILKGDKATVAKFGGIIDTYTIDQAVRDEAVVPLLYEGRHVVQRIDQVPIDEWFQRYTAALSQEQQADLKRKYASADQLNRAEQKIHAIAWDVSVHFRTNFQGRTPFKGQLVCPSKADALLYKKYLDEFGMVTSEVLISPPDTREGHSDVDEVDDTANRPSVLGFWERAMRRYGSAEAYRRDVIGKFKNAEEPEIVVVVDMLLTGFDAPRNAVLYLTRALKEHTLLQAIARVNRVYEGKDHGLIVDYYGVLGQLDEALDLYTAFDGRYDPEDLAGVLTDLRKAVEELPQRHGELWDVFKTVRNKSDQEAMEGHLADEEERQRFYRALAAFARQLKLAMSSADFHANTPREKVERYRYDLTYFLKLRASVARRYAEAVDFRQYEGPIQKLLDTYVGADAPETIVTPVDIFDTDAFKHEVEQFHSPEAKAEVIANRIRRTIHERMDEDPVFYRKFSEMLEETRLQYQQRRFDQIELLNRVTGILDRVQKRQDVEEAPAVLHGRPVARTYYDVVGQTLRETGSPVAPEQAAEIAVAIDEIIKRLKIVHWQSNTDVQNRMKTEIEDELFRAKDRLGIDLDFDVIDRILDTCIDVARRRES